MTAAERQRRHRDKAATVVKHGIPELVAAMEREELSIDAAALIAKEPAERQRQLLRLPAPKRAAKIKDLGYRKMQQDGLQKGQRFRKITIPWSPKPAVSLLVQRWPASLLQEFHAELARRITGAAAEPDDAGSGGL